MTRGAWRSYRCKGRGGGVKLASSGKCGSLWERSGHKSQLVSDCPCLEAPVWNVKLLVGGISAEKPSLGSFISQMALSIKLLGELKKKPF